jgi:alkanesulfonate monooxygenase SsuD/methylene tetrahydromethanopterin reductase-like flavin-dependent oxidoreductase (luciferase family)
MLDHLSEGRFEFGTGRGSSSTEFKGFGIPDGETTRAMYDESLREILRMWRETAYSYRGTYFSMPERNVLPQPYSKPHPPLWVAPAAHRLREAVARLGLGALCFTSAAAGLEPLIKVYKDTIKHAEPVGDYVNDNVACVTALVCLDDGAQARRVALSMGTGYHTSLVFRYLDTFPRPAGVPAWPALIPEPTREQLEARIASGQRVVGDPDECARGVQKYVDVGCDQLIFGVLASSQPQDVALRSVALFGSHVQPRFDKDPVHSTTRMREAARAKTAGRAAADRESTVKS